MTHQRTSSYMHRYRLETMEVSACAHAVNCSPVEGRCGSVSSRNGSYLRSKDNVTGMGPRADPKLFPTHNVIMTQPPNFYLVG